MWHFLQGYVIIDIEGSYASRLLQRMMRSGVRAWNVTQVGDKRIRMSIPLKNVLSLRKLRRGIPVRIRFVSRHGLPFLLKKLLRRPFLSIGMTVAFITAAILSSRIWIIRIDETHLVDPEEILQQLRDRGVYPGAYLKGPILITAANDLSAQIHDAAWIGLDREGVTLKVNVVEAIPESLKASDHVPCDIIAEKGGVITSVEVMRGQARVKVGDRVKAGDVLISGTVFYKDKSYQTSADGIVKAAVLYRSEAELPRTETESYETEATETVRVLRFAGVEILRSTPSFAHYRLTGPETIGISNLLPVTIETYTAREICFRDRTLTDEESAQYALSLAREQAYAYVPRNAAIIHTYGTIRTSGGNQTAVVTVTAEEFIGRTEEVPHDG